MNKKYIDFVPGKNPNANRGGTVKVRRGTRATTGVSVVAVQEDIPASGTVVRKRMVRRVTTTRATSPRQVRTTTSTPVRVMPSQSTRPARVQRAVASQRPIQRVVRNAPAPRGANVVRAGARTATGHSGAPALGVIEDLNTKFVRTDVPKRPLNQAPEPSPAVLAEAKAKKLRGFRGAKKNKAVEKSVDKQGSKATANGKYEPPKSPFINQGKVEKRPLSKNSKNAYAKKKPAIVPKAEPKGTVAIIQKPPKESHVGIIVTIIITIILGAAAGTVAFLLLPK